MRNMTKHEITMSGCENMKWIETCSNLRISTNLVDVFLWMLVVLIEGLETSGILFSFLLDPSNIGIVCELLGGKVIIINHFISFVSEKFVLKSVHIGCLSIICWNCWIFTRKYFKVFSLTLKGNFT